MNASDEIKDLAAALAKAQGEIKNAPKDSNNPHFKAKYADLASIWSVAREPLSKNGLSVIQMAEDGPDTIRVTTRLLHSSGQWIESSLSMAPTQKTPQGIGSCITYARRYGLAAMVGVAPDDDDDANLASAPVEKRQGQVQARNVTHIHQQTPQISPTMSEIIAIQKRENLTNDELVRICEVSTFKGLAPMDLEAALDKLKDVVSRFPESSLEEG